MDYNSFRFAKPQRHEAYEKENQYSVRGCGLSTHLALIKRKQGPKPALIQTPTSNAYTNRFTIITCVRDVPRSLTKCCSNYELHRFCFVQWLGQRSWKHGTVSRLFVLAKTTETKKTARIAQSVQWTSYRLADRRIVVRFPGELRVYFFLLQLSTQVLDPTHRPVQWARLAVSGGVMRSDIRSNRPLATSTEVKNVWSYILMAWCLIRRMEHSTFSSLLKKYKHQYQSSVPKSQNDYWF